MLLRTPSGTFCAPCLWKLQTPPLLYFLASSATSSAITRAGTAGVCFAGVGVASSATFVGAFLVAVSIASLISASASASVFAATARLSSFSVSITSSATPASLKRRRAPASSLTVLISCLSVLPPGISSRSPAAAENRAMGLVP